MWRIYEGMLTVVFLATVDWEDVEDAGTYETGFAWLTGTDREGSTAQVSREKDS